ncbi:MAG: hypothetical protein CME06_15225 [Gemmatimonadetes bacterium]|nr:hypothetical protein [Gemmatimonadota bacterium]
MRIMVDISIQGTEYPTGVNRVQRSLLAALARLDQENEYLLVSKRHTKTWFDLPPNFQHISIGETWPSYMWREWVLPSAMAKWRIDLIHSPVSAIPLRGDAKKIATEHDLPWVESNATTGSGATVARGHRSRLFLGIHMASKIVAVSNKTRDDIVSLYPDGGDRVVVIHNGIDACFRPLAIPSARALLLHRYGIPDRPYVFFVGTRRRKKNLCALLDAFMSLSDSDCRDHQLVLAGIRGAGGREIEDAARSPELRGAVHVLGYVADDDLVCLYNHAKVVVYPSLFEGFGLPPLEAMACGTPVLASSGGAIPEVVGDAALLFSPDRPKELADALKRILRDPELRCDLRRRGLRRAQLFSWERSAGSYMELYRELIDRASGVPSGVGGSG